MSGVFHTYIIIGMSLREILILTLCVFLLQCAVKYEITGDGLATSLFSINEDTGVILLDEPFTIDIGTLYVVRLTKLLSDFIRLKIYFYAWKTLQKICGLLSTFSKLDTREERITDIGVKIPYYL